MSRGTSRESLALVAAALWLAAAPPVRAETPAQAPPPPSTDARRILLGAGGGVAFVTSLGPLSPSYAPGLNASVWSSLPVGAVIGFRPAVRLYDVGASFGAGPGARLDLELGFEFTLRFGPLDVVLALATAVTFRATEVFNVRAIGVGPSLGLQGLLTGRLGWYARTTHRLTVTIAESLLLHQLEAGLLLRL